MKGTTCFASLGIFLSRNMKPKSDDGMFLFLPLATFLRPIAVAVLLLVCSGCFKSSALISLGEAADVSKDEARIITAENLSDDPPSLPSAFAPSHSATETALQDGNRAKEEGEDVVSSQSSLVDEAASDLIILSGEARKLENVSEALKQLKKQQYLRRKKVSRRIMTATGGILLLSAICGLFIMLAERRRRNEAIKVLRPDLLYRGPRGNPAFHTPKAFSVGVAFGGRACGRRYCSRDLEGTREAVDE